MGVVVAAIALGAIASCCPPPDPQEPVTPPATPIPVTARTRAIKPALLGRFEPPSTATQKPAAPPKREMIKEPPLVPPAGPKTEPDLSRRETLAPPAPIAPKPPADRLPDDVVLKLIETGRAAFVRCFKKAVHADPTVLSFKVRVHVELDGDGAIRVATADTTDTELGGCLVRALGWLRFPASGRLVAVDLPLFYRAE
ncbi:MAG TPA: hypothetical protein VIV11_26055 [Kofleriaceae bacterium]